MAGSSHAEQRAAVMAALELADRGWPVFPCRPRSKRPATAHGLKDATLDPGLIRGWWEQEPDANVGLRTGIDGMFVLDIDAGDGVDSFADDLLRRHGAAFCATVSARTPRGGYHLWYRTAEPIRNSASKVAAGIDVRGTGGYVVVPPSVTDRPYMWIHPPSDTEVAAAPDWLLERVAQAKPPARRARGATYWRDLAAHGVREGARNDSCARLAGHLLARGVDPFVCLELVTAWDAHRNRPPLGAEEAAQVVRSIARRETERWR